MKINDVIQNLDPKIFKSKNQFIIDAIQFYIDNYGKETFVIKKKEKERAEYIRSEDIDDIKEEVIEAATNEAIHIEDLTVRFKNGVTAIDHADLDISNGIFSFCHLYTMYRFLLFCHNKRPSYDFYFIIEEPVIN